MCLAIVRAGEGPVRGVPSSFGRISEAFLDGITATERILAETRGRGDATAPRIIILTTHQREVAALRAITAGASGFLMKDATPEF